MSFSDPDSAPDSENSEAPVDPNRWWKRYSVEEREAVFGPNPKNNGKCEPSLAGLASKIKNGEIQKITVMCGAGISCSAGIPDFRSRGSGLYSILRKKYGMEEPELIFDIRYFIQEPGPFNETALEMLPGKFKPTKTHFFLEMLRRKGLLERVYTQNIDTLEKLAGLPDSSVVYSHGSFADCHCISGRCQTQISLADWRTQLEHSPDKIAVCPNCNNLVKPDIVFFGQSLPERFFRCQVKDFPKSDCLLVLGTSLKVSPFNMLIGNEMKHGGLTPRVLINNEMVGEARDFYGDTNDHGDQIGFHFKHEKNFRDLFLDGDCDKVVGELCEELGEEWVKELEEMQRSWGSVRDGWQLLVEGQVMDKDRRDSSAGGGSRRNSGSENSGSPTAKSPKSDKDESKL